MSFLYYLLFMGFLFSLQIISTDGKREHIFKHDLKNLFFQSRARSTTVSSIDSDDRDSLAQPTDAPKPIKASSVQSDDSPAVPKLSQEPLLLQLSQQSQVFQIPKLSQAPQVPQTPQTPKLSQEPPAPKLSQTSKTPKLSQESKLSKQSQTFQVQNLSEEPQVPKLSHEPPVPKLSQTSQAPNLTQESQLSKQSQTFQVQNLSQEPQVPKLSQEPPVTKLSQTPQTQQLSSDYTLVEPTNEGILTAFDALQPLIHLYLYENNPELASGTIQPPYAAEQQLVPYVPHYRVSFLVVPASESNRSSIGNFTVHIDKQLNREENSVQYTLNHLDVHEVELPVVSKESQKHQLPVNYTAVEPTNEDILAAFNALEPLIVLYLYENYPELASGTIQLPFAASQHKVPYVSHYRVSFLVVPATDSNRLSIGNFTIHIDKKLNRKDNSVQFTMNHLEAHEVELSVVTQEPEEPEDHYITLPVTLEPEPTVAPSTLQPMEFKAVSEKPEEPDVHYITLPVILEPEPTEAPSTVQPAEFPVVTQEPEEPEEHYHTLPVILEPEPTTVPTSTTTVPQVELVPGIRVDPTDDDALNSFTWVKWNIEQRVRRRNSVSYSIMPPFLATKQAVPEGVNYYIVFSGVPADPNVVPSETFIAHIYRPNGGSNQVESVELYDPLRIRFPTSYPNSSFDLTKVEVGPVALWTTVELTSEEVLSAFDQVQPKLFESSLDIYNGREISPPFIAEKVVTPLNTRYQVAFSAKRMYHGRPITINFTAIFKKDVEKSYFYPPMVNYYHPETFEHPRK